MDISEVISNQILEMEDTMGVLILAEQELEDVYEQRDALLKACKKVEEWARLDAKQKWDLPYTPAWYIDVLNAIKRTEQAQGEGEGE